MKHLKKSLAVFIFGVSVAHADVEFKPYGFLLPNWIGSNSGLESFSQPNSSAFTAVGNPSLRKSENDGQATFQVAQSRIGLKINQGEAPQTVSGLMEFDFIDFTKSSPTTSAVPRVRRAFVQWGNPSDWTFKFGQDWDLVSGSSPYTYNIVGHYFQTGDVGFMRLQMVGIKKSGNWEHGFALGFPTQNSSASGGAVEMSILPTIAVKETWSSGSTKLGFSLLGSSLRVDPKNPKRVFAGMANVFVEAAPMPSFNLMGKVYVAQNSSNLGMLGLAFADLTHPSMREAGMMMSFKTALTDESHLFGGAGIAFMVNPEKMLSSYAVSGGPLSSSGPGIESNSTLRLGYDHVLAKSLTGFSELSYLMTRHHLIAADTNVLSADQTAVVLNIGAQYNF